MLVGQPDSSGATPAPALIPTGTVIIPSSGGAPAAERFMRARRELRDAYRLHPIDQKSYDEISLAQGHRADGGHGHIRHRGQGDPAELR